MEHQLRLQLQSTNDDIYLVGEPYIYVRLTETSLGPFEAVELSTDNQHYNRFFAKIPIDSSRPLTQQYFSHDTKWINWKMTANPFPRIHELRVETLRYYGRRHIPLPQYSSRSKKSSHESDVENCRSRE